MIFGVKVNATGWGAALFGRAGKQFSQRAINRSVSSALEDGLKLWHSQMLPDHFKPGNTAKYNYQPRKAEYKRRKAQRRRTYKGRPIQRGGLVDLVYTGDTERQAKTRYVTVAKGTTARLYMYVPFYITTRRRFAGFPDMTKEILAISQPEERKINTVVRNSFYKRVQDEIARAPMARAGG